MTQNSINNTASILTIDNTQIDGNTISTTTGDTDIGLEANGTGSVSVTSSAIVPSGDRGKNLGRTTNHWDNVYADGLTFDDGSTVLASFTDITSWTPVLVGQVTPGTATYSTQFGEYTRIGDLVILNFHLVWTGHTGSGNFNITGSPFTPTSTTNVRFFGSVGLTSPQPANILWATCQMLPGNSVIYIQITNTAGVNVSYTDFSDATLGGSIWFFV